MKLWVNKYRILLPVNIQLLNNKVVGTLTAENQFLQEKNKKLEKIGGKKPRSFKKKSHGKMLRKRNKKSSPCEIRTTRIKEKRKKFVFVAKQNGGNSKISVREFRDICNDTKVEEEPRPSFIPEGEKGNVLVSGKGLLKRNLVDLGKKICK